MSVVSDPKCTSSQFLPASSVYCTVVYSGVKTQSGSTFAVSYSAQLAAGLDCSFQLARTDEKQEETTIC